MYTILNIVGELYNDSKIIFFVYLIGFILLFVFILILIFSLKQSDNNVKTNIIDENIDTDKEEIINEDVSEIDEYNEEKDVISKALDNAENDIEEVSEQEEIIEPTSIEDDGIQDINSDIPDIDEYVDNIVKKAYAKNEQFSSVYLDNSNPNDINKLKDDDTEHEIPKKDEKKLTAKELLEKLNKSKEK